MDINTPFLEKRTAINFGLWGALIVSSLIPLIYTTTRIHFLGNMPDSWAFSIAAQVAWLNIGYEIINEALLVPLAFILGKVISTPNLFTQRVSVSLRITVATYAMVTAIVLGFTPELVSAMQQQGALLEQTVKYIRLESIAIFISSTYLLFNLVFVLHNKQRELYGLLLVQMLLTVICDSFLVSQLSISFQMGVTGIAVTNILVNLVLLIVSYRVLIKGGIRLSRCSFNMYRSEWILEWLKIGSKSGLESLVRNTAFVVMILQLMNQLEHAGTFWIANGFIWGWLLLPVLSLGQLVKQDAATNNGISSERVNRYLIVTVCIFSLWIITAPYWEAFVQHIMGVRNADEVTRLVYAMVGFYVVFALNNVIDSYFYGIGRTDLMLYQSLAVNSLFYGITFIFYQLGWFVPTLYKVAIMFGLGITFDALITWGLYRMLRRQESQAVVQLYQMS